MAIFGLVPMKFQQLFFGSVKHNTRRGKCNNSPNRLLKIALLSAVSSIFLKLLWLLARP
jgi:hypothetical protein